MRSTRLGCVAALAAVTGCRSTVQRPLAEYMRALPPGASALRLVTDPRRLPDIAGALRGADESLRAAVDESILWYSAPSSRQHFPCCAITHAEAQASLVAMRDLLSRDMPAESLEAEVRRLFDVYESVGYDGSGVVLFTGYFSPIFPASPTRTERFGHPLYRRPADLVTDPVTAAPLGRRMPDGSIAPWPTRREIESSGMLAGTELVWLEDPLSAYIVHVNGSARLRIEGPDGGRDMYVGYAGKTDRPYTGLGRLMVDEGLIRPEELSLAAIRRVYERDPQRVLRLIERNQSYVFFTEYDGDRWPQGSLGVRVTPLRSLATDRRSTRAGHWCSWTRRP
jgi:membrane-bound lytic murein transglycosylase A